MAKKKPKPRTDAPPFDVDAYLAEKSTGALAAEDDGPPDDVASYLAEKQARAASRDDRIAAQMSPMPSVGDKLKAAFFGQEEPDEDLVEKQMREGPQLGDRWGALLSGVTPEEWHRRRVEMLRKNPAIVEQERAKSFVGSAIAGAGAAKAAASALPALGRALPALSAAPKVAQPAVAAGQAAVRHAPVVASSAGAAAGTALDDAAIGTGSPQRKVENVLQAMLAGPLIEKAIRMGPAAAKQAADEIRASDTQTGADIRTLEAGGARPSPMPFQPVANATSKRLGVRPTPEGRGIIGRQGARALHAEADARMASAKRRMDYEQAEAYRRQGGEAQARPQDPRRPQDSALRAPKSVSTNTLVAQVDEYLNSAEAGLNPELTAAMQRVRGVLTGQLEPTVEIYPVKRTNLPEIAVESAELDPDWVGHRRIGPEQPPAPELPATTAPRTDVRTIYRGGRQMTVGPAQGPPQDAPAPLNKSLGRRPADYTAHAGEVEGFDPERLTVPAGDVRGRVGDDPNYVLTPQKLDILRDKLDDVAGMVEADTGIKKEKLPFLGIANQIRAMQRVHAPAIALKNKRYSMEAEKVGDLRERMGTEDQLATRLSGQNQPGSQTAGARTLPLEELHRGTPFRLDEPRFEGFPPSHRLPQKAIDDIFENPRRLMAEERMKLTALPRRNASGGQVADMAEPLIARGVYAPLRAAGDATLPPDAAAILRAVLNGGLRLQLREPPSGGRR